jgi:hypothetical protein
MASVQFFHRTTPVSRGHAECSRVQILVLSDRSSESCCSRTARGDLDTEGRPHAGAEVRAAGGLTPCLANDDILLWLFRTAEAL